LKGSEKRRREEKGKDERERERKGRRKGREGRRREAKKGEGRRKGREMRGARKMPNTGAAVGSGELVTHGIRQWEGMKE